ncbi:hypothetical protein IPU70_28225 [Achromobacter sp. SD115]|jgi:hypothetical protein|uniref:Uncharacterized protein n=1 Tax=Achromobacter insolitus TaxID=217204 RepID=A0A6S7F772_9BURK|nr:MULTISPECIES: hypothetical protein [Achromobacter]MBC9904594.1 hypothetical protein [Achromobacter xylosoxidans]MBD0868136.1 hypothetical protein [Achromobacter xylosoxidans]MBO1017475.1 hypothetical protein [Achromobacter sp. SD115]MBO9331721.1 hypothetical protein [Achromobacter xylosoxidans]MDH0519434.1 hypothetical protein [Achromobacter xylosoxidans]
MSGLLGFAALAILARAFLKGFAAAGRDDGVGESYADRFDKEWEEEWAREVREG